MRVRSASDLLQSVECELIFHQKFRKNWMDTKTRP